MATSSKLDSANRDKIKVKPMSTSLLPFFSLPAEVRIMIYRQFFAKRKIFLHRRRNCKGKDQPRRLSPLNLFLTNHQMHDETLPIYLSDALFTFERNICRKGKCNKHLYIDLSRHQSPHFHSLQRIECDDGDANMFLARLKRASIREVVLLVDFERWLHLVGYPHASSARMWSYHKDDSIYPERLPEWLGGTPNKVILQLDWHGHHSYSIWRDEDEPLPTLPDQDYQNIVFEDGQDVVVRGIAPERHKVCEAIIREIFKVPADKTIRFEGTPINGIYYD